MSINIFARVISTTMEDSRFLDGETIQEALSRDAVFGKLLKIFLDNNTYLKIEPVTGPDDEQLIGCDVGTWERMQDNTISITS